MQDKKELTITTKSGSIVCLMLFRYSKFAPAYFVGTLFSWLQRKGFKILSKRRNHNDAEMLTETYSIAVHHIMIADKYRVDAYQNAINKAVTGKNVLDIGTGPYAFLAQMAVVANAKYTTGVEASRESYNAAIAQLNPAYLSKITIDHCYSTNKISPEENSKYDLLIHEIIGCIGSDEGSLPVVKDAKERLLTKNAQIIPHSFSTHIISVSPLQSLTLFESILSRMYMDHESIFDTEIKATGMYDVFNFPIQNAISDPNVFETFNFNSDFDLIQKNSHIFKIKKQSTDEPILFDGFVLFLELVVDEQNIINSYLQKTNWNVIYIKLLEVPREMQDGEEIHVKCEIDASNIDTKYSLTVTFSEGTILSHTWNGSNPKAIGKI